MPVHAIESAIATVNAFHRVKEERRQRRVVLDTILVLEPFSKGCRNAAPSAVGENGKAIDQGRAL